MSRPPKLADDLLVGAKAAADYVGVTARIMYDMVDRGYIPVVKIGDAKNARLFFRKSILDAKFLPEADDAEGSPSASAVRITTIDMQMFGALEETRTALTAHIAKIDAVLSMAMESRS